MASALIQSNAQSALIATLNSASGASVNPFEYTLSKRVPSHGVQWTKLEAVNPGAVSKGSTLSFDLTKMGITRSATFQVEVVAPASATATLALGTTPTGFLNLIDHVDIESSSRRVLTMSRAAMMCAYSDLPTEQRNAFERGVRMMKDTRAAPGAGVAVGDSNKVTVYIPLLFSCFDNGNLALATGFTEPMRVSITLASDWDFAVHCDTQGNAEVVPTAKAISLTRPRLIVEHRLLPNEMEDATIAANYSQGPLSQLVYDYETETSETAEMSGAGSDGVSISHEIKSTAVATDIYVFCEIQHKDVKSDWHNGTSDTNDWYKVQGTDCPLPLETISFTASGQNIVDEINAEYLGLFSRRTLKDGFFGNCPGGGFEAGVADVKDFGTTGGEYQIGTDVGNPCFVYRLQFGLDNSKQYDSNGISLRELNAPTIKVKLAKYLNATTEKGNQHTREQASLYSGKTVTMHTVIRKLGLQTTDSSSGRVVSTLSN